MLYNGPNGPSTVSEDFNQSCIDFHIEAQVQSFPNPGDLRNAMRLITFRNFSDDTVQINQSGKIHLIPARGTVQVMLKPDEPLPVFERME